MGTPSLFVDLVDHAVVKAMITVVPLAEHLGPVSGLVAELINRVHDVRAHTASKRTSLLGRGARWMVGATQPGLIGDREYLQHRLHRLLRFHAEHGHRPASAPLTSQRRDPSISEAPSGSIPPARLG